MFSPFLNLPHCHIFDHQILCTIFEGVSYLIIATVFAEMLKFADVSIDVINNILRIHLPFSSQKISIFNLCYFHLPFTASQMCYLLQFVPSMMWCFFLEDSITWSLLLTHCEIVKIISSPHVVDKYVDHLKYFIIRTLYLDCTR